MEKEMEFRAELEKIIRYLLSCGVTLREFEEEAEKIYISEALRINGGKIKEAAKLLGLHRNTLS
ncbi:MAG: hypothetical protein J7L62_03405, partial [Candidatus Aminicenantes bacterium]|nr:hypothetical protein [Candidatus Aminicenantes bacterium]